MDKNNIKEKLAEVIPQKNIVIDCPMAKRVSFRCGGKAALFVTADSIEELKHAISVFGETETEYYVLGNGSNTLFTDEGYEGAVISLGKDFSEIIIEGNSIYAGAAALLPYVSKLAAARALSGLEFACGIPGSVGGAVYMNAGAYGSTMADAVKSVTAITEKGELYEYSLEELELSYRHSRFTESGEIVLSVHFELSPADPAQISSKMEENNTARKTKQPLNYPSAGSFFKRPEGYFAGALIEQAGLKGCRIGGAEVSSLHAGFIINADNAKASDVLALCRFVQKTVKEKSGILLEPEVRIIGKWS